MLKPPDWKSRQSVRRSVGSPQGRHLPSAPSNREIEDEDDDEDEDEKAPQGTGFPTVFSLSWPKYSAIPAAPIHATPHFVAFFVPRVVVYVSSQDFVETALSSFQPFSLFFSLSLLPLLRLIGYTPKHLHAQTRSVFGSTRNELCNPLDIRVLWHAVSGLRRMFHGDGVYPEP
jgi:hypothetical protein